MLESQRERIGGVGEHLADAERPRFAVAQQQLPGDVERPGGRLLGAADERCCLFGDRRGCSSALQSSKPGYGSIRERADPKGTEGRTPVEDRAKVRQSGRLR